MYIICPDNPPPIPSPKQDSSLAVSHKTQQQHNPSSVTSKQKDPSTTINPPHNHQHLSTATKQCNNHHSAPQKQANILSAEQQDIPVPPSSHNSVLGQLLLGKPSQHNQPSIEQPSLDQPSIEQPSLDQPSVEQLSLDQPSIEQPSLDQPSILSSRLLISHLLSSRLLISRLLSSCLLISHLLITSSHLFSTSHPLMQ